MNAKMHTPREVAEQTINMLNKTGDNRKGELSKNYFLLIGLSRRLLPTR